MKSADDVVGCGCCCHELDLSLRKKKGKKEGDQAMVSMVAATTSIRIPSKMPARVAGEVVGPEGAIATPYGCTGGRTRCGER